MATKEMTTVERAFNECHEQIYNHALRVVKNIHDAEDIRGAVYEKLQKLESAQYKSDKKANFSSWIHTITNHVILDFFRTNHQDNYISDYTDEEGREYFTIVASNRYDADKDVMTTELRNKIAKAFRTLKPNYRRVAVLYFLNDLPYNEIADILNIPMGSVKGMLSRCREKLQEALKDNYTLKAVNVQ